MHLGKLVTNILQLQPHKEYEKSSTKSWEKYQQLINKIISIGMCPNYSVWEKKKNIASDKNNSHQR